MQSTNLNGGGIELILNRRLQLPENSLKNSPFPAPESPWLDLTVIDEGHPCPETGHGEEECSV